jgi:methyl-accepting chemotaxis protein
MTNEQSESDKQPESTTGYLGGLGTIIDKLLPEEKLIGALLVGILGLLGAVISSVPEGQRKVVWFATIGVVIATFLLFQYWTKYSASKLGKIKKERVYWEQKANDLRKDYGSLATNNNSRLSEIDDQIRKINQSITHISGQGHINNQEASALVQQLTRLAGQIQEQIAQNSSDVSRRIEAGIKTVAGASDIARRLQETDNKTT